MKTIATVILAVAIVIVGLSVYLMPDDLAKCESKPTGETSCKKVDAIVAVSGGDTEARTREAIRLYENGWASLLIFSGAAQDKSGPSNAEVMQRQAIAAGVPASAIALEEQGETTKQNAENTQNIFSRYNVQSAILVTSGYHQRRAALEFNARTDVTVVNHPVAHDNQWSWWWWLTPVGWFLAVSEFIKIIAFYIGGSR